MSSNCISAVLQNMLLRDALAETANLASKLPQRISNNEYMGKFFSYIANLGNVPKPTICICAVAANLIFRKLQATLLKEAKESFGNYKKSIKVLTGASVALGLNSLINIAKNRNFSGSMQNALPTIILVTGSILLEGAFNKARQLDTELFKKPSSF